MMHDHPDGPGRRRGDAFRTLSSCLVWAEFLLLAGLLIIVSIGWLARILD